MPSQKNIDQLASINSKLDDAKNIIFADPTGLNVSDQSKLRREVKAAGGEYTIVKNRLLALALKNRSKDLPQETYEALNGPTAIMYSFQDAVSATKALVEFAKQNDQLTIKVGVMAGTGDTPHSFLDADAIQALAKLPSRDQLRAKLIGQLAAPLSGFTRVLQGNLRGLVQVLEAHRQNLSS